MYHPNGVPAGIDQQHPRFIRAEAIQRFLALGRDDPPSYWYPTLALVAGLATGAVINRFTGEIHSSLSFLTYNGGAEAARSFVTLTATALATIITLTLSLTVISLQLASSQYSPRLVEHYLSDRANHAVFSLFMGTIAFSIATLLNIRLPSDDGGSSGKVPSIGISVLVVLLVACLVGLVLFVHRVTSAMQVSSILQRVRDRTIEGIDRRAERRSHGDVGERDEDRRGAGSSPPADARPVRSRRSGYFAALDRDALSKFEPDGELRVWILVAPGTFVTEGTPVAAVDPGSAGLDDGDGPIEGDLADAIESWLNFDQQRWIESDEAYGIRSLVDVALRGLSPGVNDPTTATMAIERLGETLAYAGHAEPVDRIVTKSGVELSLATIDWSDLVQRSVRQIFEYGSHDVEVVLALIDLLVGLAWAPIDDGYRDEVAATARHLRDWLDGEERLPSDDARVDTAFERLAHALGDEFEADEPSTSADSGP